MQLRLVRLAGTTPTASTDRNGDAATSYVMITICLAGLTALLIVTPPPAEDSRYTSRLSASRRPASA
jgi:hypothetical protein